MSASFPTSEPPEDYVIGAQIGSGGSAAVFRAVHVDRPNDPVAIKVMHVATPDPSRRRRFERECEILRRLDGRSHTMPILDAGIDPSDRAFIVTPLYPATVADRLASVGALPIEDAIHIASSTATALDEAHRAGVVHRDVKPANVFLDAEGGVVLGDFGSAGLVDAATFTGSLPMSVAYAAPETLERGEITEASDLYALGVTLHQMLTGTVPFAPVGSSGESVAMGALVRRVVTESPPPLPATGLPAGLSALVMHLMAKDPAARPRSAADVVDRLTALDAPHTAHSTGDRRRRARLTLVGTSAVAAMSLAGLAFAAGGDESREPTARAVESTLDPTVPTTDAGPAFVPVGTDDRQASTTTVARRTTGTSTTQPTSTVPPTTVAATVVPDDLDGSGDIGAGVERPASAAETSTEPAPIEAPAPVAPTPVDQPSPGSTAPGAAPTTVPTTAPIDVPTTVGSTTTSSVAPIALAGCGSDAIVLCESFDDGFASWTEISDDATASFRTTGLSRSGGGAVELVPGDGPSGNAFLQQPTYLPGWAATAHLRAWVRVDGDGSSPWYTTVLSMLDDRTQREWEINVQALRDGSLLFDAGTGVVSETRHSVGTWMCVELFMDPSGDASTLSVDGRVEVSIPEGGDEVIAPAYATRVGTTFLIEPADTPRIQVDDLVVTANSAPGC